MGRKRGLKNLQALARSAFSGKLTCCVALSHFLSTDSGSEKNLKTRFGLAHFFKSQCSILKGKAVRHYRNNIDGSPCKQCDGREVIVMSVYPGAAGPKVPKLIPFLK